MSVGNLHSPTLEMDEGNGSEHKLPSALDLTTCSYAEGISPLFDPNRVLLRRVFFLDSEKTKYISVGFYPARNYQPCVELGGPKSNPIVLTDQHVQTLAEHLSPQCEALLRCDFYTVQDGDLAMHTKSPYKTAVLSIGDKKHRKSTFFKLNDLRYLSYIFYIVQNQLKIYTEAMSDVMNYAVSALSSVSFVEPSANANKNILYYQLFDELKAVL